MGLLTLYQGLDTVVDRTFTLHAEGPGLNPGHNRPRSLKQVVTLSTAKCSSTDVNAMDP